MAVPQVNRSPTVGHFGCFWLFAIISKAATNIYYRILNKIVSLLLNGNAINCFLHVDSVSCDTDKLTN